MIVLSEKVIRQHIRFYGRVQGVGFRYYAVNEAQNLGLTGWVENLDDGSVEMEVQGSEEQIDMLIRYLESRDWVYVEKIQRRNIPLMDDREFVEKGW